MLVTGAARGIGAAIAAAFAERGDTTFMVDIDGSGLTQHAELLRGSGGAVHTMTASVADTAGVASVTAWVEAHAGRLDVLVNNAAVPFRKAFFDTTDHEWDEVLGVGLKGAFIMSRGCWPLLNRPGSCIVNISSVHRNRLLPGLAAYGATKGGIDALTKAMALDAAPYGVRVNAVAPGFIDTTPDWPPPGPTRDEHYRQIAERVPAGACGEPDDVAQAVLWLTGPQARYVSGTVLEVDGALAAQAYPPLKHV